MLRQEHDRQGRVPGDRGDRDAMCEHPREPLERAQRRRGDRLLDDRLERGGDARRARAQAEVGSCTSGCGQAGRSAESGHGDQRPGLLGEARELLGRRDAPRADGGRPLPPLGRRGGQALRREHDRRRRDPRFDVRRLLRARGRDLRGARRLRGGDRDRYSGSRRRRFRWVRRAFRGPGDRLGFSAAPGSPRSTRRGTSTASSTPAWGGSSGATPPRCRKT